MDKPGQYCARCRTVHKDGCPHKPKHNWQNKVRSRRDGRGGRPWRRLRRYIFERDAYLCQICIKRDKITPVELSGPKHGVLDHITPETEGGTNDEENLQTICQACDKTKSQAESTRSTNVGWI